MLWTWLIAIERAPVCADMLNQPAAKIFFPEYDGTY